MTTGVVTDKDVQETLRLEYKTLWDYHNKLHDEQGKFIEFYLKAVGLPVSALSIAVTLQKSAFLNIEMAFAVTGALCVPFFLLGTTIIIGFVQELANQRSYIRRITDVRAQLAGVPPRQESAAATPSLSEDDIVKAVKAGVRSGYSHLSIGFWRSQSIIIMNTTVGAVGFALMTASIESMGTKAIANALFAIVLWVSQTHLARTAYGAYLKKTFGR